MITNKSKSLEDSRKKRKKVREIERKKVRDREKVSERKREREREGIDKKYS